MSEIIAIHQPNYIPWLGYFYKIYQSDIFVFLDNVQFSNKGMHEFHYIKNPGGRFRLKIPVRYSYGDTISQVETNQTLEWRNSHLNQIAVNYRKAKFFELIFQDLSQVYNQNMIGNLSEFNIELIKFISGKMGFKTEFVVASGLEIQNTDKNDRIIEICKSLNAAVYYSGNGASAYQNPETFASNGIELRYSSFKTFEYPQLWGSFESNISIIDFLMNCGYDWQRVLDNQI